LQPLVFFFLDKIGLHITAKNRRKTLDENMDSAYYYVESYRELITDRTPKWANH
jgi:hypothetical protein